MLGTPNGRRSKSNLPSILMGLALVAGGSYYFFFRPKPAPAPVAAAPAAPAPKGPDIAAFQKAFSESLAAAPVLTPAKPVPKVEVRKAAPAPAVAPVKFEVPAPPRPRAEVDGLIAEGKWREARSKVASLFGGVSSDADRSDLGTAGIRINQELLQNRVDEKEAELYEIQQGDTLESIAKKFRTLSGVKGSIMYVNNYKENAILRAGRKVRVAKGTWSILVDKSLFKMWVLYEGCPFKTYTITTGAPHKETPATKFVVGSKNPKPAWWPPADTKIKGPVAYGDAQNPLGEWWISLEHDLHHGIGIHGTNDPGSIGTKASNGCVRMLNEDVVEVAALAFKGMAVTVVE